MPRLTQLMANLVGPTVMTWQTPDGRWHAEVTTDEGLVRAKARGAIRTQRERAGTWDWQPVTQENDPRTTRSTTYWSELFQ